MHCEREVLSNDEHAMSPYRSRTVTTNNGVVVQARVRITEVSTTAPLAHRHPGPADATCRQSQTPTLANLALAIRFHPRHANVARTRHHR